MSKTGRQNYRRGARGAPKGDRQIVVRGVRRDPPDLRKLSRAVIAMALTEAEATAEIDEAMKHGDGQTAAPPATGKPDTEKDTGADD
ncbi:hypothetical protein Gbro_1437 [Gordonia bronchialis DSM 43247]|uniref:Uncharacterized protein n=1 Tax=Gordonia bronchialis (strain ATCC 25592 / DSM 43247 / BCRC 13721 / JCM 3198 / KCTC 3076 / NBRC 16047 / NCTC 10667) TaxID=526226 RepID=D0L6G2_GORB4|nr:hypothetical protein [Gordonia bronchialis]ACY20719.1 hypothetical protein Gbro_1437 [Gordonia bronchialis DSM 43247]MCC3323492.1 hypothetical protein [Gordonia bronchialis]QGS25530.1 hypothetical protein FOB84_16690 [Gordonia bronchialis]STQ63548.1 Uncharacterised protein [Gordonia bronchialis]